MAIRLEVRDYCMNCLDFEADVAKPERTTVYSVAPGSAITRQTDTIVRCKYATRCHNLVRYLNKQSREGEE